MSILRRTWGFVRPYNTIFILMVITVIFPVMMELAVPRALSYVIDEGIELGNMEAIVQGVSVMLLAALFGVVATLGQGVFRARNESSRGSDGPGPCEYWTCPDRRCPPRSSRRVP